MIVLEDKAKERGWTVGDVIEMRFARTGVQRIPIDGTYTDDALERDGYLLSLRDSETNFTDQLDERVLILKAPAVSHAEARAAIESITSDFPDHDGR